MIAIYDRSDSAIQRPPSLKEIVATRIAEMILSDAFQPGDRLVEDKLARQFGVSRGPVRDAFKLLESEGLIEVRGPRGAYVAKPSTDDVEQMFVMRAMLEGLAARYAAASASTDQIDALGKIVDEMKEAAIRNDLDRFRTLDWDFHESICKLSEMPALVQTWRSMKNLIRAYQKANVETDKDLLETAANHIEFIEVIRNGQPDRAEALLRYRLIQRGYELLGKPPPPSLAGLVK